MWIVWMLAFILMPILGIVYVSWHIWTLLPLPAIWRGGAVGLFVLAFLLMFASFLGINERLPLTLSKVVYEVGNSMIMILLYLVLIFVVMDLCRFAHIIPKTWLYQNGYTAVGITCFMVFLLGYGYWHFQDKCRQELTLKTSKAVSDTAMNKTGVGEPSTKAQKKIVMLSDLHLGYHIDRKEFARWVDIINAEHPDLILIGGDIIDISVRPLLLENVAEEFHRLKAPVYACLGNHEYYASEPKAKEFYDKAGVVLLRDRVANVDGITIIGRDDRTNPHRKSLKELMKQVDRNHYMILLDHQPYHLEEAEKAGIDFQFSGHTHDGQVWPISWITKSMYEKSFGYLKKGNTEYYVSSGMGIWGAKFRIGTRSEYVVATLGGE